MMNHMRTIGSRKISDTSNRLLGRSRRPPLGGHTPAGARNGLACVGSLEQLPNAVFQQSDGLLQRAELSNPHDRDGRVQGKRWGTQDFHGVDGTMPDNKASRQQPDSVSCLNER